MSLYLYSSLTLSFLCVTARVGLFQRTVRGRGRGEVKDPNKTTAKTVVLS
jgi:hypothetical protein